MNLTSEILEKAIIFATNKHKGQIRKSDGRPYILHPLSVLHTLYEVKQSKNAFLLACAVLLHDVVEDNKNMSVDDSLQEIAREFGYNVAALVQELTSNKEEIKKIGKATYLSHKMINMSSYALCIKLCDRFDNTKDLVLMKPDFKKKYILETNEILENLKNGRKLTKTHNKIIRMIESNIKKINDK